MTVRFHVSRNTYRLYNKWSYWQFSNKTGSVLKIEKIQGRRSFCTTICSLYNLDLLNKLFKLLYQNISNLHRLLLYCQTTNNKSGA